MQFAVRASSCSSFLLVAGLAVCLPASADERFWSFQGNTSFEAYYFGAYAAPHYWHDLAVPGAGDTMNFGYGPAFPPLHPGNVLGSHPTRVHFGAFNYHSFLSGIHTSYAAQNATVGVVRVHNGDWTFDFGSGVGGWGPLMPAPSQGSLTTDGMWIAQAGQSGSLTLAGGQVNVTVHTMSIGDGTGATGLLRLEGAQTELIAPNNLWVGNGGASGRLEVVGGARATTHVSQGAYGGSNGEPNEMSVLVSGEGSSILWLLGVNNGSAVIENGAHVTSLSAPGGSPQSSYIGAVNPAEVTITGDGSRWTDCYIMSIGGSGDTDWPNARGIVNVVQGGRLEAVGVTMASRTPPAGPESLLRVAGVGSEIALAHDAVVGYEGRARLSVENGAQLSGRDVYLAYRAGGRGLLDVLDGGTMALSGSLLAAAAADTIVDVRVEGDGSVMTIGSWLAAGYEGEGNVLVSDGGEISSDLIAVGVDADSSGVLTVSDAGAVTTRHLIIGSAPDANGEVILEGPGSMLETELCHVGSAYKGNASLHLRDGATMVVSDFIHTGSPAAAGGAVVTVESGATLDASWVDIGTTGEGAMLSTATVDGEGSRVSASIVVSIGADISEGRLFIRNGGLVEAPNNSFNVGLDEHGEMTIEYGGRAHGYFGRVGRLIGGSGEVVIDGPGSEWSVVANMFIGGHTATGEGGTGSMILKNGGRMISGSELRIWSQGVLDVEDGGRALAGSGDPDSIAPGSLMVGSGGTLAGTGLIRGYVMTDGGSISPGHSAGTMSIEGSLSLDASSTLMIELGGSAPTQHDRVAMLGAGSVEIAGTLNVQTIDGYIPVPLIAYTIIESSAGTLITGRFGTVVGPALPDPYVWKVGYTGPHAFVCATCPADYNVDFGVDVLDFLDFLDDFGSCENQPGPCGALFNADINGDTFVDVLDFLDFFDGFGQGC